MRLQKLQKEILLILTVNLIEPININKVKEISWSSTDNRRQLPL